MKGAQRHLHILDGKMLPPHTQKKSYKIESQFLIWSKSTSPWRKYRYSCCTSAVQMFGSTTNQSRPFGLRCGNRGGRLNKVNSLPRPRTKFWDESIKPLPTLAWMTLKSDSSHQATFFSSPSLIGQFWWACANYLNILFLAGRRSNLESNLLQCLWCGAFKDGFFCLFFFFIIWL